MCVWFSFPLVIRQSTVFNSGCQVSYIFLFCSPLPTFSCIRAKIPVFSYIPVQKRQKRMDNENSERLWIKFLILVVCISNGEYEKQQSVNLMYISMEMMCIHVSLVFLMFSIFKVIQILSRSSLYCKIPLD